jgi:hypothetical protein
MLNVTYFESLSLSFDRKSAYRSSVASPLKKNAFAPERNHIFTFPFVGEVVFRDVFGVIENNT